MFVSTLCPEQVATTVPDGCNAVEPIGSDVFKLVYKPR